MLRFFTGSKHLETDGPEETVFEHVNISALENATKRTSSYDEAYSSNDDTSSIDKESGTIEDQNYVLGGFNKIARNLNAEVTGVERIPENQRPDKTYWHAASMWWSTNFVLSAYAVGVLGPLVFGINFGTSVLTVVFFNILGAIPVAFCSVFGSEFGLRQMILSRVLLGSITGRFFSFINCIACCGWAALNTLVSAELLNEVNKPSGHNLPLWGGCLVIIGGTIVVSSFGYKVIHSFEKYSWIPNFAVFLVIIARLKISGSFSDGPWDGGRTTAGGVLSFGSAVFGFAAAWATYAADYTVYMPRDTNKWKIFITVLIGLSLPLIFTQILGAAVARGAFRNEMWMSYYKNNSAGGLTYAVLVPESLHQFGDFCCVVLSLSAIAINTPGMYTLSLSVQAVWEPFARLPRILLNLLGCGATLGISIPAAYFFHEFLENFMNSTSYYAALYISLFLTEHFLFRRSFKNYHLDDDWNTWKKLPIGLASGFALVVGAFGVALGMDQTYWVGEIARKIGKNGGDVGFELGMGWSFVAYLVARPLELKYFGR